MSMRTTFLSLAILPAVLLGAGSDAAAQSSPGGATFTFGPPLRANVVFSYRYTERVRDIHEAGGEVLDSGWREMTYFISQRQRPLAGGRWQVEVNVDSMRTEYIHRGDTMRFNTQTLVGTMFDVSHREILGPSSIVNRVAMVTLSPYGEVLDVKSESFDFVREQITEPVVDAFTRERVLDILTPEYLTGALLPWRGVLPLGQAVTVGDTVERKFGSMVDRIPFVGIARVVVTQDGSRSTANFTATVDRPVRATAVFTELLEPVSLRGLTATMAGGLMLDPDGVVVSGWTTIKGTVTSDVGGTPMTTTVWHESVTELIGTMRAD